MSKMSIRGAEYAVQKIFSDDFVFTIPLYQRAYAWTTEESEELFQDLLRAMGNVEGVVDDIAPYFLGSIVLIKGDEPNAEVVDGQQRLTTLTMLLAALRSLIPSGYVDGLTTFLCEKGNVVTGTPTRYRLRLRERDAHFFQRYIQDEGGISELKSLQGAQLSESQRNIRDNTLGFVRELQKLPENQLIALTQFIVKRCFLIIVAVASPDLDSVYRIFSVLNSRGLNLSYPDILKSEIINAIPPEQREIYADKWEEIEISILGSSEIFEDLFFYLRAIYAKKRQNKGLIEEFHEYVYPQQSQVSNPQDFIENTLMRYAHALNYIERSNYYGPLAKEINSMFKWLNVLDDRKMWVPPVLFYLHEFWQQSEDVLRFLKAFERLVVSFMICRVPAYRRIDRYCELLQAMADKRDVFASNSPLQLTSSERRDCIRMLEGNIYLMRHVCKYVLLRLDTKLSGGEASYDYQAVSIEHVLPQRPASDSQWMRLFPTKEIRDRYVNRLGNLVLLSRGKNMRAENVDFDEKKLRYFSINGGISPFVITTQVLQQREWTPDVIEQRQKLLLGKLKALWNL